MKRVYILRYPYRLVTWTVLFFAGIGALLTWMPDWVMPALAVRTGEKITTFTRSIVQMLDFVRHGL